LKQDNSNRCSVTDEETFTNLDSEVDSSIAQGDAIVRAYVADLRSDDFRPLYSAAGLGCVRGVVWAFGFQGVVVIAVAICLYVLHG
jgi:hypothetical protein